MPDWLKSAVHSSNKTDPLDVAIRIAAALVLGWMVSWIYKRTRRDITIAPSFPTTLVLLSALIAMVTQVIGDNVARAFSLVGALSIVRFRTVVRDTQDTAYVIFAVVVGMAVGANDYWVAGLGMAVVGGGAFLMRRSAPGLREGAEGLDDYSLSIRLNAGVEPAKLEREVLAGKVSFHHLLSMETAKQGMVFDLRYRVRLKEGTSAASLIRELNQTEGVQGVRLEGSEDDDDD